MNKSYVLRGRMSDAQEKSYNNLAPRYCVPFSQNIISFAEIFGNENPVTCEIGFGMGSATAEIAEKNPCKNYLGIEVYKAGIGRLLWEIENRGIKNIRIIEHDAVEVIQFMIADETLAACHIFFPDPWPKKRHHKRRLIQKEFTTKLAKKMMHGAYLYFVSDWADYGEWALAELNATLSLKNNYDGFAPAQTWRPPTKFEAKGKAKSHEIRELYFTKI